jgi:hypothetical protein
MPRRYNSVLCKAPPIKTRAKGEVQFQALLTLAPYENDLADSSYSHFTSMLRTHCVRSWLSGILNTVY